MNTSKIKAELNKLNNLLTKYAHRWVVYQGGERVEPSTRMYEWVDRYNELASDNPKVFAEWCAENGTDPSHNAYDVLA